MAVGIIAEYNPFHNGHIHHINKIKEMFPNEEIIVVMSSSFVQRGDVSIINKWDKTKIALNYVDLVIELPFFYTIQSADTFAYGSISILNSLGVDKIVFGSECNDINKLKSIVDIQDKPEFNNLVKKYIEDGNNYPTALSLSINELLGYSINDSNDLLGISYLKVIKNNNYLITPYTIKRTNNYNDLETTNDILSATGIRKMLYDKKDISKYVPEYCLKFLNKDLLFLDDFFDLLKYKIISCKDLSIYKLVDEGIENRLKKYIYNANSLTEYINLIKTKRYTYNKINRILICILCDFTKEESDQCTLDYIKVLGFNDKGRTYLNSIKKDIKLPLITGYDFESKMLSLESRVSYVYSLGLKDNSFIKQEFLNQPIKKD